MAKDTTESMTLVLENGEDISITFPMEIAEEMFDEMSEAQSRDAFWNVGNWTSVNAMYKGFLINHINMKRVIGFS